MGSGGPVALNQMAIHAAMDLYEIDDKLNCFEKVVLLSRHFIKKRNEELNMQKGNR
jgi:hypothetical protein